MRIIEWNCQGAFRLKNKKIFELNPDILIIPECETEEKLNFGNLTPKPKDFIWQSDTGKKGIGIFSFSSYKFKILKEFNPKYRHIIPIEVSDGLNSFLLFAIWAMDNKQNPIARYIGQVWLAVNYYNATLTNNSLLVGDFNSNQIWDEKERIGNHTDMVNYLSRLNINSLYRKQENEEHGQESQKTFFMYRNPEKSYHIDYVFASKYLVKNGYKLTFEKPENWLDKSDHIPLILDIFRIESKTKLQHTYYDFVTRHLKYLNYETREKYIFEIKAIQQFAKNLDLKKYSHNEELKLIDKIETLKEIDKLSTKLKK